MAKAKTVPNKAKVSVNKAAALPGKVTVTKTGEVCELDHDSNMTLGRAINLAGYCLDNVTEVRVNGQKAPDMDAVLKPGDQITLLGKIAGA